MAEKEVDRQIVEQEKGGQISLAQELDKPAMTSNMAENEVDRQLDYKNDRQIRA